MAYIGPAYSVVAFQGNPSVLQAVVTVTNFPTNPSISGTVAISNFPVTQNVSGSVVASGTVGASIIGLTPFVLGGSSNASVITVGTAAPNQSVSGTVGASIIGLPPVNVTNFPTNQNISGSVVSFINGTPNVNTAGSVVAFQGGIRITSVVGSYSEDAGHTGGDTGLFAMGVRNDTMASITSADLDYSPHMVGPSGETVVANAPLTKWVSGQTSLFGIAGQPLIAAQGASIFTYITAIQVVNTGAVNSRVALLDSSGGGVLAYVAAPAGGGSNVIIPNGIKTLANGAFMAQASVASSVIWVSASGFISKS